MTFNIDRLSEKKYYIFVYLTCKPVIIIITIINANSLDSI